MNDPMRARAEALEGRGLSDREIDHELQLIDQSDRWIVWGHIIELRKARAEARSAPTRPPLIPDLEPAMRQAIAKLRSSGTQLTWSAVATEISSARNISYTEPTLRRNAKEAGLPHPSKRYWR